MKVCFEKNSSLSEDEIIIQAQSSSEAVEKLLAYANDLFSQSATILMYKEKDEFFVSSEKILFFETYDERVIAHTADDVYRVKYRLYELEQLLSDDFIRISKSAVVNVAQILSLHRSLSSSALVQFRNSHKEVYASRMFIKPLKQRLEAVNNLQQNSKQIK